MSDRVFCIGNGENRLSFPIEKLKCKGKIYCCNAIYRDYPDLIDVLTGVDYGICHEIYHSGYAQKVPCYFRGWTKVPAHTYDDVIKGGLPQAELDKALKQGAVVDNGRGDSKEYVLHGSDLRGVVNIIKKDGGVTKKKC